MSTTKTKPKPAPKPVEEPKNPEIGRLELAVLQRCIDAHGDGQMLQSGSAEFVCERVEGSIYKITVKFNAVRLMFKHTFCASAGVRRQNAANAIGALEDSHKAGYIDKDEFEQRVAVQDKIIQECDEDVQSYEMAPKEKVTIVDIDNPIPCNLQKAL